MKIFVFGFDKADLTKFPAEFEPIPVAARNWPSNDLVLVSSLSLTGKRLEQLISALIQNKIRTWRNMILYIPKDCPCITGWTDEAFQKKIFEGEWEKLSDLFDKECPICSDTNKADSDFCTYCGWNLGKKVTQNFCVECGEPIPIRDLCYPLCQNCLQTEKAGEDRFLHCVFCGKKLAPYCQKAELGRHCPACGARIDDVLNLV